MIYHNAKRRIKSKNVRKFTSREEVEDYLSNEVFYQEHFIRHVQATSKQLNVSYVIAYTVITNYLIDILYDIDKNITAPRKKVQIRGYGYFSLQIGFMISSTQKKITELLKFNQRKK